MPVRARRQSLRSRAGPKRQRGRYVLGRNVRLTVEGGVAFTRCTDHFTVFRAGDDMISEWANLNLARHGHLLMLGDLDLRCLPGKAGAPPRAVMPGVLTFLAVVQSVAAINDQGSPASLVGIEGRVHLQRACAPPGYRFQGAVDLAPRLRPGPRAFLVRRGDPHQGPVRTGPGVGERDEIRPGLQGLVLLTNGPQRHRHIEEDGPVAIISSSSADAM